MAQNYRMKTYITDKKDIEDVRNGTARINGKEILLVDANMKTATRRIFSALSKNPDIALVAGLGLCLKSSAIGQWRRISVPELKALVLDAFVLVREQTRGDGQCRLEILPDVPNPFWLPTVLQGRWIDPEVESWFPPIIKQDKVKIITRP
jgi:hypothetical protein